MTTTHKRIPKGTRTRCGNRRVQDREALTRRGTWGVLRDYSPMASSTVRARIHARCASQVVSSTAPDARRLAR